MILIQFFWLQKSSLFPVKDELDGFAQFSFQGEVQEHYMTLLLPLIPASFSEVSHSGIVRVFHEFVKHPTILEIESKQYVLANLRGIEVTIFSHNCQHTSFAFPQEDMYNAIHLKHGLGA